MSYRSIAVPSTLALFLCGLLCGCVNEPEESGGQPTYLFEATYINWAWGYVHTGRSVDSDGNVWSFDWEDEGVNNWDGYENSDAIAPEELLIKYAPNRKFVARLDKKKVAQMAGKIYAASRGSYSASAHTGNDAGGTGYTAFLYDSDKRTYREVELETRGDWSSHNLSSEATELVVWLKNLPK